MDSETNTEDNQQEHQEDSNQDDLGEVEQSFEPNKETEKKPNRKPGLFRAPREITVKSLVFITTAFGLVAALAWNEAIKALISHFFKRGNTVVSLFVYAVVVTILAVIITTRLTKINNRLNNKNGEQES